MSRGESVYCLGSRFDTGSIEDAVCNILAETRGCFKYVVTLNVHHRVRLLEDPATMQPALRAGAAFVLRLPRAEPPGLVQRSVSARHYRQLSPTVIEAALGPRLSPR